MRYIYPAYFQKWLWTMKRFCYMGRCTWGVGYIVQHQAPLSPSLTTLLPAGPVFKRVFPLHQVEVVCSFSSAPWQPPSHTQYYCPWKRCPKSPPCPGFLHPPSCCDTWKVLMNDSDVTCDAYIWGWFKAEPGFLGAIWDDFSLPKEWVLRRQVLKTTFQALPWKSMWCSSACKNVSFWKALKKLPHQSWPSDADILQGSHICLIGASFSLYLPQPRRLCWALQSGMS